jgi:hypothetical protein
MSANIIGLILIILRETSFKDLFNFNERNTNEKNASIPTFSDF